MQVLFYTCTDDPRTVSKRLQLIASKIDVHIKRDLSIMEPELELEYSADIEGCNYLAFDSKYYFVKPAGMIRATGGRLIIQARLDVLKTYDTKIRALPGIPARVEDPAVADWYLHDSRQPVRAYRSIVTRPGNDMYFDTAHFLLLTAG